MMSDTTMIDIENEEFIVGEEYKLVQKIGSGSFGEVYLGENISNPNENVAVKVESISSANHYLQREKRVYKSLRGFKGYPKFKSYIEDTERGYNFLVLELVGPTLEELFEYCSRKFSVKTVLMLADQMLDRIEFLHCGVNYIHRDIKPDNFLMGLGSKRNQVFLIDFGLAIRYRNPRTFKHIPLTDNNTLVGTPRYVSVNVHQGKQSSRRDDLESLGYLFIYFLRGNLPWMGIKARTKKQKYDKIMESKLTTTIPELCNGMPKGFAKYLMYVRGLEFDQVPDYVQLRHRFQKMFRKFGFQTDKVYDWDLLWMEKNKQVDS